MGERLHAYRLRPLFALPKGLSRPLLLNGGPGHGVDPSLADRIEVDGQISGEQLGSDGDEGFALAGEPGPAESAEAAPAETPTETPAETPTETPAETSESTTEKPETEEQK